MFQPNTTISSVAIIRIINDNIPEETESFYLTLEIHNDTNEELNIIDSALSTTATILDDDHDGMYSFLLFITVAQNTVYNHYHYVCIMTAVGTLAETHLI